MTARGNLVAVIPDGSSGIRNRKHWRICFKTRFGGEVLPKRFAEIDAFDVEIDEQDPGRLAEIISPLEPTFGGVIL